MRQIGPKIIRTFRHQLELIRPIIPDNWLYNRIEYLIGTIECLLTCPGADVRSNQVMVADIRTLLRYADLWAAQTHIINTGPYRAVLYENGVIIGISNPGTSKTLTLANKFIVDAQCDAGESTVLTITDTRRCACGGVDPRPYGESITPVGGDLI